MEFRIDARNNIFAATDAFQRPAILKELADVKNRLAVHAKQLLAAQDEASAQLGEARMAMQTAEAELIVAAARVRAAEVAGDAAGLVKARRAIPGAEAAVVAARELFEAAQTISLHRQATAAEELSAKNEPPMRAMRAILDEIEAEANKEIEKALAGPLAKLGAVWDARCAFMFSNVETIKSFALAKN